MTGVYCTNCQAGQGAAALLPEGTRACPVCGMGEFLCCATCNQLIDMGTGRCISCAQTSMVAAPRARAARPAALTVMPVAPRVVEQYSAGRYGVEATVTMPAIDVEILNELGGLVALLHQMASKCNQFTGLSEHTRSVIRSMRILATDVQEEIENRLGPRR